MTSILPYVDFAKKVMDAAKEVTQNSADMKVEDRDIHVEVKGRFHSLSEPWVWDGYALDVKSGISAQSKHYKGQHGAMEHAVKKLCDKMREKEILK